MKFIERIIAALRDIPRELAEGSRKAKREAEFRRELLEKMRALNEASNDPNWVPPAAKPKSKMRPLPADSPLRKGIFVMHGFKLLRDVERAPKKTRAEEKQT